MAKGSLKEITKGFIKENPVLRLVLGTCPTLAVSTSAQNAIGMGVSVIAVLICSNIVVSLLRKVTPDKVRIPIYITVIASFVTIVQLFVKAFAPSIDQALGVYLPLITVNCIILGRAEAFAGKNGVLASALDGLGMGIGFTGALFLMGAVREILGSGSFFGNSLLGGTSIEPIAIFILPPGGFFIYGILIAVANKLANKKGKKPAQKQNGCGCCAMADGCPSASNGGCGN
jgi:electron transport complex protein RnfE